MTVRSPLRAHALLVAILTAACALPAPTPPSATAPTPSASEAATAPAATPMLTPAVATVPPFRATARPSGTPAEESLATTASTEHDGIKLTIRLGNNPVWAGNGTQAFVTIENTGDRLLRWTNDGCDTNAGVLAIMPATWRDSTVELAPELEPYRDWLREEAGAAEPIWLRFTKAEFLRYRSMGCADLGIGRELGPGRKVTQAFTWDGDAAPRLGLPPTGPVTLTSRFERWTRPGLGREGDPIEVSLKSWVLNGRSEDYLSPAEAIDAALADDRFASWLLTRPLRNGNAIAEYDRDLGVWAIGLLTHRDDGQPILHAAFVDAFTGEVIAIREHRVEF